MPPQDVQRVRPLLFQGEVARYSRDGIECPRCPVAYRLMAYAARSGYASVPNRDPSNLAFLNHRCYRWAVSSEEQLSPANQNLAAAINRSGVPDRPSVDQAGNALNPQIGGVSLIRLTTHHDDRGSLTPLLFETGHPFWEEPVVHAYSLTIRPGRIKGWGMHRFQTDRYFVASGSLRVVLFDGREGSPSCAQFAEYFFTDSCPGLLRIPPGVWHADQNWGDQEARRYCGGLTFGGL